MKFNYIIFLFFTLFTVNICAFINSKYIKDLSNIAELDLELKKSNITSGMILIYSTGCGHCHHFLPTYELLANKYNNKLLFFAMSVYSDYHKRMPRTWGVPFILFFSDGYFYNFKPRRTFEHLSSIIENNYLQKCKQITYKNIENVYYNIFMKDKKYNNLIIGFFDDKSEEEIEKFRKENDLLNEEYLGLCYVCKDFGEIKESEKNASLFKFIENKMIIGYLKNNVTKIFKWDNIKNDNNTYINYEKFIKEELKSNYIDINEENKKYLINFLRNKKSLIYSYKKNDEKNLYENYIDEISNITKYKINFVLYNISNFNKSLFNNISEDGLYEIDEELNFINKYINIVALKNEVIKKYKINNTNNNTINELLIPEVKKENKEEESNEPTELFNYDLFFEVLEKICVILFTIVLTMALFFLYYNIYYKKVDQDLINLYQSTN